MSNSVTSLRRLTGLFLAGVICFASCKEKGPTINFGPDIAADTTYVMTTVETPQPRRILIEEATGVKCPNCPAGANIIKSLENQHPGLVIPIGIHAGALTDPLSISNHSFRFGEADDLMNSYFAEGPNKPSASIDRVKAGGNNYFIDRAQWAATANARLQQPKLMNITITSSYTPSASEAMVKVRVSFVQPVSKKLSLSLFLVENGIVDPQEDGILIDTFYTHNHVLRDIITPISGASFLDSLATKVAGRVYEYNLLYKKTGNWNPDNCRLVAFVHSNEPGDKEVLQVAEAHLK